MTTTTCRRCGGEVVSKPRLRLVLVGLAFVCAPMLTWISWRLWVVVWVLVPAGVYLIAWAALGRGRWCRGCKRFDGV